MLASTISFRSISYLVIAILSNLITACASYTPVDRNTAEDTQDENVSYLPLDSQVESAQDINPTRGSENLVSGAKLVGQTIWVDPIVRPFTSLKAFYGLTIKSAGSFIERTFIEYVRFPLLERKPVPTLSNAAPMDLEAWERELDELATGRPSSGEIKFLIDGEAYFDRLTTVLGAADESIDIRSYIFDNDDVALQIANLLRDKSTEVEVKVLVDGLASLFANRLDSDSMPDDVLLPASISRYMSYASRVKFRKQSNPWFTGDHVKLTVVDANLAFVGGMNIGREYRYDWHDLMMEVEGPIVKQLQYEFDQAWAKAGIFGDYAWLAQELTTDRPGDTGGAYPIRVLKTSIHDSELYRAQVAAIRRSRQRIFIENTYFSDDKILFELARARRRGVDVRVILSATGDNAILNLSNQEAINTMLRNGIRVYSYPGMTHVKAAVYDGWACLGSANFDKLSLQINQEINLGTSHPAVVENLLESLFYPDFAISDELHDALPLAARHHFAEFIADELL
jgi:cardiolipin synthase